LVYGLIKVADHGWGGPAVIGFALLGLAFLAGFAFLERHSANPMMPLDVFRSQTFSGVNLLTLLLYGALDGTLFFLPFLLIQVHGYSATAAGAAFLPFTIMLAVLSQWGGGLVDRVGARIPLIAGPAITGVGFLLLCAPGSSGSYWSSFLLPMMVLGLGMAVTIAPLTTAVLNAVPKRQAGVASGINNAVASVAGLLLIAVLSSVAVATFNSSVARHLTAAPISSETRYAMEKTRVAFAAPSLPDSTSDEERQLARSIVADAEVTTVRGIMMIAAMLAFAGAIVAMLMIAPGNGTARRPSPG
jgi:MFS family permease